ncbi:MAG TPA: DinB family protein [Candidatus Koribacter sp.]|jgi:hypothetical protein
MNDLAREFWARMEAAEQRLSAIGEPEARMPYRLGGWTRKQILGHLVDSACVNHVRVMFAATTGAYTGESYDQSGWVALHGWGEMPWSAILDQWRARNTWLAEALTNIPQDRLGAPCTVGQDPPMRLDDLIRDYLAHLEHHVTQVAGVAAGY